MARLLHPGLMAAFGVHLIEKKQKQVNTLMKTSRCNEENHARALHLASFALRMGWVFFLIQKNKKTTSWWPIIVSGETIKI